MELYNSRTESESNAGKLYRYSQGMVEVKKWPACFLVHAGQKYVLQIVPDPANRIDVVHWLLPAQPALP